MLTKVIDKTKPEDTFGLMYRLPCDNCPAVYIGETGRSLKTRLGEHKKALSSGTFTSAVAEHAMFNGHPPAWNKTTITSKEPNTTKRKFKEAIVIYKEKPKINRDQGYEIPDIY